ncbi:MAG: DUF4845 domain-containing protein [Thiobacillus sp. 65-29]|nr:MAG: DUF4845 domain-containing protein [Thiobacillus sp. 65-29]
MKRFSTPSVRRQRGLSMIGFLLVAALVVMAAMVAMKLVPAYIEFFSVKKILVSMSQEADFRGRSNADIRNIFSRKTSADYVSVVKADDLMIDRSSGTPVVSVDYEFRTKLIGNVSLVVDFSASSDPNAASRQIE